MTLVTSPEDHELAIHKVGVTSCRTPNCMLSGGQSVYHRANRKTSPNELNDYMDLYQGRRSVSLSRELCHHQQELILDLVVNRQPLQLLVYFVNG